jgi:undecaprenyl-diphosphatase
MQKNTRMTLIIVIIAAVLFTILTIGVVTDAAWITSIDNFGRHMIRENITPFKTRIFTGITYLAQPATAVTLTAISVIIALIAKQRYVALFLAVNVIGGAALMALIKRLVQRPRPVDKLIPEHGFSFPSGHSVNAMVFYGSLLVLAFMFLQNHKWLRNSLAVVLTLTIFAIPVSRVYLGVHYPTDVIAGLLLGLVVLTLSSHFILPRQRRQ